MGDVDGHRFGPAGNVAGAAGKSDPVELEGRAPGARPARVESGGREAPFAERGKQGSECFTDKNWMIASRGTALIKLIAA